MEERVGLKESQRVAKNILDVIVKICNKFNLRYYLFYGTLIGAIRHQDFIPWDDDLDIIMPREDYNRFVYMVHDDPNLLEGLQLFDPVLSKKYPYMIGRVSDPKYKIIMDNENPYGMGLFVDIYPFDGLGNNWRSAYRLGLKGDRLSSLCYQSTRKKCKIEVTTSLFRKIIKYPVFKISKIIGVDYFKTKIFELEKNNKFTFDNSDYVGCLVWLTGGKKDIFKKSWLGNGVLKQFGDNRYIVPTDYDKVLRHIYGNYMKLPPKKDRIGHHNYYVIRND